MAYGSIGVNEKFSFEFECKHCGKCCILDSPVMLDSFDIYYILKGNPALKFRDFTDVVLLDGIPLPVLKLKTQPDSRCIFHIDGRCSIHKNKPRVCAFYPICVHPDTKMKLAYELIIEHEHHFYNQKKHTVHSWLNKSLTKEYKNYISVYSQYLPKFYHHGAKAVSLEKFSEFKEVYTIMMYSSFNYSQPFLPQFVKRLKALDQLLQEIINE